MTSTSRRAAALAALVLAGSAVVAVQAAPAGAAAASKTCRTSQLSAKLADAEGAAGSTYVQIVLRNVSGKRCSLAGWPGVSFVAGDDGHQVGHSAVRERPSARHVVNLDPGKAAKATLRIANAGNYPAADCDPKKVRGLRVYPPNSYSAMYLKAPQTACADKAIRQLHIDPVRHA